MVPACQFSTLGTPSSASSPGSLPRRLRISSDPHEATTAATWTLLNGSVNVDFLQSLQQSIMARIIELPGQSIEQLCRQFPLCSPAEIRRVLEVLQLDNKIIIRKLPVSTPTLFSSIFVRHQQTTSQWKEFIIPTPSPLGRAFFSVSASSVSISALPVSDIVV